MQAGPATNLGDILVVDDTIANVKLLMELLTAHGYKVRPASDGEMAIAAVAVRRPDLILLDIKMPGIDGYEVCRRLKKDKKNQEIPIIFISALASLQDRIKGFEVGGVDYITKPLQQEEILARVRTHLQLHRMQEHLEELVKERTEELRQSYLLLQKSETKTRESEKKFRTLFESSSDAFMLLDDKIFFDCNAATLRIFGCPTREQFLGSHPADWSPPTQPDGRDSKQAAEEKIAAAFHRGQNFFEWVHKRADGQAFFAEVLLAPMEINGRQVIQATVRDISKRRQMEEDRLRLNTAIAQMTEVVVITDADAMIQYVNPAFEHLTGYSREEVIGQNPNILQSGEHDRSFYEHMWKTLLNAKSWHGHLINRKKDGTVFEEEATISPVLSSEGKITNFVAVKRDVTKEISLEKQLHQAMKLEAIGTLAGGIAHDFNNILSAIIGFGDLARMQLPDNHPVRNDLDNILKAGKRAAALTRQILTFSRQEESAFESFTIQPLVKEVIKLLRSTLPTSIDIKLNISADCGPIFADPSQIHQVLMNLCTNAKLAMGDDAGTLSVSINQIELPDSTIQPLHPEIKQGPYLDLEVRDTGCGMDGKLIEKIFDPFFTTREQGQGTGLGLSVVYGIVKKHHGAITVSSEPGQGTSFHVYLPVIPEETIQEEATDNGVQGGRERILIVDDEPSIVRIIKRQFEALGYRITATSDSKDALEKIRAHPGDFDLLITDQTMPGLTGTALTAAVHEIRPDLPVILSTGQGHEVSRAKALEMGIQIIVPKPVIGNALFTAVRSALDAKKK